MKGASRLKRPLDRDIARQVCIGATDPGVGVAVAVSVKVDHLHEGVYTGVGATSTERGDALRGELGECLFELVLNGKP